MDEHDRLIARSVDSFARYGNCLNDLHATIKDLSRCEEVHREPCVQMELFDKAAGCHEPEKSSNLS